MVILGKSFSNNGVLYRMDVTYFGEIGSAIDNGVLWIIILRKVEENKNNK